MHAAISHFISSFTGAGSTALGGTILPDCIHTAMWVGRTGLICDFDFLHSQEHKLVVPVADLGQADAEIAARMGTGLDWTAAAAGVYQELGRPVDGPAAWAAYMALRGSRDDEHAIVSLKVLHAYSPQRCC